MTTETAIDEIRAWHRRRCFAMEQRKRANLALGSFLRTQLGWRRDLPEADRNRIAKGAAALIACGEKLAAGKNHKLADTEDYAEWAMVIAAAISSRAPWDDIEDESLKNMQRLAKSQPVWSTFVEPIRGFGAASLAVIIGEAGDLSNYSSIAKLWKRMGLAVLDGKRQGGLPKNASAELWIAHGYNRQRRSRIWNIGDALIKGNGPGIYRQLYLTRKAFELQRDPQMRPMHAHRRAQRYMEKRLLRDLWRAWRAIKEVKPTPNLLAKQFDEESCDAPVIVKKLEDVD